MTPKQLASKLKTSPKNVRRILRTFKRFQDGHYTRYRLTKADVAQLRKAIA